MEDFLSVVRDVALVLILAGLAVFAFNYFHRKILQLLSEREDLEEERQQQLETLIRTLRWLVNVLIVGVALLMILGNFVDITPVLASVGVAGLAISLGAQTLIKDLIGGFLVLIENQYGIGDVIEVGDVSGVVEQMSLRSTRLRSIDGSLHIVPNGEVRIVSNVTKDWSRAMAEVGVAYEEDLDRALQVLEGVAEAFAQDPAFQEDLLGPLEVTGPISLGDWAVTVRVMVKTRPGKHWGISRELQKRVLAACEREGITLPYPRQEVLMLKS